MVKNHCQVVKTVLPRQGVQVLSLVGELRSHVPHGAAKKDFLNEGWEGVVVTTV